MKTTPDLQALRDFQTYVDSLEIDDSGRLVIPEGSLANLLSRFAQRNPQPAALVANSLRDILIPRRQGDRIFSEPFSPRYDSADLPAHHRALAETAMLEQITLDLDERMNTQADNDALAQARIDNPSLRDVVSDAVDFHSQED